MDDCTTIRLRLSGVGPPWTDALRMGTLLRMAAIRATDTEVTDRGWKAEALARLSGHGLASWEPHACYLSEDLDRDGRIDHLVLQ